MRVCRTCSVIFLSVKKRREKILCVSIELVQYFSFRKKTAGENSMPVYRNCSVFFLLAGPRRSRLAVGRDVEQNGRGSAGVCATPRVSGQLRCRTSWRSHCGTALSARHLNRLAGTHFCSVFLSPPLGARLARLRMRHPRASACAVVGMCARPRTPTHVVSVSQRPPCRQARVGASMRTAR